LVPRVGSDEPAIGRPIDGTDARVLDADLLPVDDGEVGELFLSGRGVARGYLGRPGLTADRFLPDPWAARPGTRMYRTGDLVRRHRGELMFLGRSDSQVKIRGHRIEMGEIDAVLVRHLGVSDAVTVCDQDAAGEARLVTYAESTPELSADSGIADLRQWLGDRLPDYAVPGVLMVLSRLPRTPNGKVDRAVLPAPEVDRAQSGVRYVAPVTPLETQLAAMWSDLLGVDQVGLADRFDDLGGHSLLAGALLGQIETRLDTSVPLSVFLAAPTPAGLAAAVETRRGIRTDVPLVAGAGVSPGPLSPVQEDFWFSEQLPGPPNAAYTVPVRLRVRTRRPDAVIDATALNAALNAVVARHEALRTAFTESAGEVRATVVAPYPVDMPETDLRAVAPERRAADLEQAVGRTARAAIDITGGRLLHARLVRLTDDEADLVIAVHHIGFDGWSSGVLVRELGAELSGVHLPDPAVQAADYTAWRMGTPPQRMAEGLAFWRSELAGADLHLSLPTDRPRPAVMSLRGRRTVRALDPELLDGLWDLGRRHHGSLFATLLAGLDVVLHQLTGRTDVVVGAPVADRAAEALQQHIGLCISTLPLRAQVDPADSFSGLLTQCVQRVHAAMAWPEISYVDVIRDLELPRSTDQTNLVQVMLAVQNYAVDPITTPDLVLENQPEPDNGTSKVDLTLFVEFTPAGPTLAAEWATDLFDEGTVQAWLDQYVAVLGDAVDRPGRTVAELGSAATLRRIRPVAVGPTAPEGDGAPLHFHVLRTAARDPHRIAVTDGGTSLTYTELVAQAEELAARLRARGAGPGALVAVCVDRHPRMVTALLAVLLTGAAYLPVDPDFPADRVAFLLADSSAALLLTERALVADLPAEHPPLLLLDQPDDAGGLPVDRPGA
ncbi:MAG: AMP-binding protein, partial [Geodermatophilaceae bacterium]|nr:AMP-binding protein [Geodermatophilaceae bacterium]